MADEGVFPKVDGDVLYGTEANKFNQATYYGWTEGGRDSTGSSYGSITGSTGLIKWTNDKWQRYYTNTTDAGSTWISGINLGFAGSIDEALVAQDSSTNNPVSGIRWQHNSGSVWITTDAGDTWNLSTGSHGLDNSANGGAMFGSLVILTGSSDLNAWRSTDGGDTWNVITSGLVYPGAQEMYDVQMLDSLNGYICGRNSYYKTIDGGENWNLVGSYMPSDPNTGLKMYLNSLSGIFMFGVQNAVMYKANGNQNEHQVILRAEGGVTNYSTRVLADNGSVYIATKDTKGTTLYELNVETNNIRTRPLPFIGGQYSKAVSTGYDASIQNMISIGSFLYIDAGDGVRKLPI